MWWNRGRSGGRQPAFSCGAVAIAGAETSRVSSAGAPERMEHRPSRSAPSLITRVGVVTSPITLPGARSRYPRAGRRRPTLGYLSISL